MYVLNILLAFPLIVATISILPFDVVISWYAMLSAACFVLTNTSSLQTLNAMYYYCAIISKCLDLFSLPQYQDEPSN